MNKTGIASLAAASALAGGVVSHQVTPAQVVTRTTERVVTPMDISNPQRNFSMVVWDKEGTPHRIVAWQHKIEITRASPQSESGPEVVFSATALEPLR